MGAIDDSQAVRDDAGKEAGDPRKELAYNESLRALTQQASVLDTLRTRTGILLAALSVTATFLGSKGLADDSLTGFGWAGTGAFAVAVLAALGVLLPRDRWEFSMDANTIINGYIEDPEPASLDEMHLEFARLNQHCFEKNKRRLGWLFWSFRISVAGLAVSMAFWLVAISGRDSFCRVTWGGRRRWTVFVLVLAGLALFAFVAEASVQDGLVAPRRTVSVIETATNEVAARAIRVGPYPSSIAISPDGGRAYVVTSGNGSVAVIDLAANRLVGNPIKIGPYPEGIAITPDGGRVYAVNYGNNSVSAIDTETDEVVAKIRVGRGPTAIAISPDGTHAYVANSRDDTVSVIDTAANEAAASAIRVGRVPLALAVAPDGTRVYVANIRDDTVSVIRTATNRLAPRRIKTGDCPTAIAVAPDGRRLYVANARDDTVSVIDTATGRLTAKQIKVGHRPTAIAVSPVSRRAYVTGLEPGSLSVINTKANKLVAKPIEVGLFPIAIALSPDGLRAYIVHN